MLCQVVGDLVGAQAFLSLDELEILLPDQGKGLKRAAGYFLALVAVAVSGHADFAVDPVLSSAAEAGAGQFLGHEISSWSF
jgi:hypothetical protein